MKRNLFIACVALLSAFTLACKDNSIDHSGEVHATTDDVFCDQYHSATAIASVYGDGITDRGICWGTSEFPTLENFSASDGTGGEGTFTLSLTDLTAGTLYYVRGYATDSSDKTYYGTSMSFTTATYLSTKIVSTSPGSSTILVKASVLDGREGLNITERGVYYGTSPDPQTTGTQVKAAAGGKGEFEVTITGLPEGQNYYLVSYAVSEDGTIYSDAVQARTSGTISPSAFQEAIVEAGLQYGAVRDANTGFVMHYSFDFSSGADQAFITITYIESTGNRDAKHITEQVNFNEDLTQATWTAVSNDGNSFSGITRNGNNFSVTGTSGLTLGKSWTSSQIYSIFTHKNYGGLNRVSELYPGNHHASVAPIFAGPLINTQRIEYNGEFSSVVCLANAYGYLFGQNKFESGRPHIPITEDVAIFEFGQYETSQSWMVSDPTQQQEMETVLQPFTKIWYDTGGLIIVEEKNTGKTPTQGDFYYYAICAENTGWVKWYLRAQE